jgi:hypothetical protein
MEALARPVCNPKWTSTVWLVSREVTGRGGEELHASNLIFLNKTEDLPLSLIKNEVVLSGLTSQALAIAKAQILHITLVA